MVVENIYVTLIITVSTIPEVYERKIDVCRRSCEPGRTYARQIVSRKGRRRLRYSTRSPVQYRRMHLLKGSGVS